MSQLVQIKQRIKAVETIQKITHAMRLISMSSHSRLRTQEKAIMRYKECILGMINKIDIRLFNKHRLLQTYPDAAHLVIIVGSQKGLCGSFNNTLSTFFYKNAPKNTYHTIFVGKKIKTVLEEHTENSHNFYTINTFEKFSPNNFITIAQEITDHIFNAPIPYASITVYSNHPKTFFVQEPRITRLLPLDLSLLDTKTTDTDDMLWDLSPEMVLNNLLPFYIRGTIQHLLYSCLIAEYAARFVSMDNATRNARQLLESTQLVYNKLRQAKITKELTELASSF